jgi:3-deoxy-D-manno-octulosonic-acid transferase
LRVWVHAQRISGKISLETAKNRLGQATANKPNGPIIWVHAASLGELSAIRPFLSYLSQSNTDPSVLITTNNPAALGIAASWPDIPAILQTAPLDLPSVLTKFLNHWQPSAFLNVETEVWPNRFTALGKRGIPCVGLNARLSNGTARRLAKIGPAIGLRFFKSIYAQNEPSAANFRNLLGPDCTIEVIPNFKSMVALPDTDSALLAKFVRTKTILAASTHSGEDAQIIAAFAKLAAKDEELKLIIAPRHPKRTTEVNDLTTDAGFVPKPLNSEANTRVYVVDTLGQLPQLYALASVTFIGGSLVPDIGGHTPYEPIRANSAIVTGNMTANFAYEFATLQALNACIVTQNTNFADDLGTALQIAETLAANARAALPPVENSHKLFDRIVADLDLTS